MGKKSLVGVDIGRHYTKIVELENKKGIATIKRAFKERTPENLFSEDEFDSDLMTEFLKSLFQDYKVRNRNVAIALNSSRVITKLAKMPLVVDEEIEQAVMWEAEQYAPVAMDQVNVSYQIMSKDKEKNEMLVLIVLTKKEVVDSYVDAFHKARLRVHLVDVDIFAAANALLKNEQDVLNRHVMLVDVGYYSSKLVFLKQGIPQFSRFLEFGFGSVIEDATDVLEMPKQEAFSILENMEKADESKRSLLLSFLKDKSVRLYGQLENSMSFYETNVLDVAEEIEEIYFCGAFGALFPYIEDSFPDEFKTKGVRRLNPFGAFVSEVAEFPDVATEASSLYSVAVGLSVRGL